MGEGKTPTPVWFCLVRMTTPTARVNVLSFKLVDGSVCKFVAKWEQEQDLAGAGKAKEQASCRCTHPQTPGLTLQLRLKTELLI